MALFSERMELCGKKVLDTAGIVREAILRQLTRRIDYAVCSLPWSERGFYDVCGFISSIHGFFLRTVLSLSEPLRTPTP
jgi:hypothetical protein